jgi:hypothetical protein
MKRIDAVNALQSKIWSEAIPPHFGGTLQEFALVFLLKL